MLCPCCSNLSYDKCCKPFHEGKICDSALQLMRSRYSAYALDKAIYIIETTHVDNPSYNKDTQKWEEEIRRFSENTSFEKLEIINFSEDGNIAYVTFRAYLKQNGKDISFTEKSLFEKADGKWLYKIGEISNEKKT